MPPATDVSVSIDVEAPPESVYDLVADLPSMRKWSPENVGAEWLGGAQSAQPGARFKGRNALGRKRWSTIGRIVTAERGRELTWDVTGGGMKVARWSYAFEPTDGGCRVTETWTDQRGRLVTWVGRITTGIEDRGEHNRAGMQQTLENLKRAAEERA